MQVNINYIISNADVIWRNVRWKDGITCTSCNCKEYYKLPDGRYKCKHCGMIFSDVSGTLLHHSKVDKWKWLYAIFKMSNGKGISNVELSKDIQVNVKTAWLMQQKIRYAMVQDSIVLDNVVCMDEAYIGGWVNMHLCKKMAYMEKHHYLNSKGRYTKSSLLAAVSHKKHHIVSLVDTTGKTLILHTPNPVTTDIIQQVLNAHTFDLSTLVTDESKLYKPIPNIALEQSNHSKGVYVTKGGYSSNVVENRFSWTKRKWNGIYTHKR